jgi:hypothetical protein
MANAPIPVSCDGCVQGSFFGKLDASAPCPRILHRRHRDNVIIEQIRDHHVPSIRESATQGPPLAAEHGRIIPFCDRA